MSRHLNCTVCLNCRWKDRLRTRQELYECNVDWVLPGIYLGGCDMISNEAWLREHGITHVIGIREYATMTREEYREASIRFSGIQYKQIQLEDDTHAPISYCFDAVHAILNQTRYNNNHVFIHCMAGVSRSVTLVASYLISRYNYSDRMALAYLHYMRAEIDPNDGFRKELRRYYIQTWIKNRIRIRCWRRRLPIALVRFHGIIQSFLSNSSA